MRCHDYHQLPPLDRLVQVVNDRVVVAPRLTLANLQPLLHLLCVTQE